MKAEVVVFIYHLTVFQKITFFPPTLLLQTHPCSTLGQALLSFFLLLYFASLPPFPFLFLWLFPMFIQCFRLFSLSLSLLPLFFFPFFLFSFSIHLTGLIWMRECFRRTDSFFFFQKKKNKESKGEKVGAQVMPVRWASVHLSVFVFSQLRQFQETNKTNCAVHLCRTVCLLLTFTVLLSFFKLRSCFLLLLWISHLNRFFFAVLFFSLGVHCLFFFFSLLLACFFFSCFDSFFPPFLCLFHRTQYRTLNQKEDQRE